MKKSLENAKKEGLTVKNVKTFAGHDGMVGINADIYKDGKKFCHIYDDAWGGPLMITAIGSIDKGKDDKYSISSELSINRDILKDLEKRYPYAEEWENSVEGIFNDLANEALRLKEFKRDEKKGVVMDGSIMKWKAGTIANMLKKYAHQKEKIIAMVQKGYDECIADGEKVLNTVYLKSIGIKL